MLGYNGVVNEGRYVALAARGGGALPSIRDLDFTLEDRVPPSPPPPSPSPPPPAPPPGAGCTLSAKKASKCAKSYAKKGSCSKKCTKSACCN